MLAATAALIDEVGYDGLTTTLIAERAGVAVGSLYQFFPDKRAVVQELMLRNLERFVQTISSRFESQQITDWRQAMDVVFETYIQMRREVPAFGSVHVGHIAAPRVLCAGKDGSSVIAEHLTQLMAAQFDQNPEQLRVPLIVAVEALYAVLHLAFRADDECDSETVHEAKELVYTYLSTRLPNPR